MSWKDKPKLNRWGNPQEKPKQISGKEKEDTDSLAAATEGKKYIKGMYDDIDHYAGEPARFVKGKKSNKMSKPVTPKKEDIEYKFSKDELKNMSTKGKTIGESIKYFAGDQDEIENSHGSEDGDEHYKNIPQPYDDAVKKALKSKIIK